MAAWWIHFYDIFKPISGLARSMEKTVLHLLVKSFWTLDPSQGNLLVPTRKALDTIASIKNHPALSGLKIEIGADFKNCGLTFSIQDLANDKENCSTALTKKTWEKGAKCISSFLHDKYFLKLMLSYEEKKNYLMTKVLSKIQHPAHSALCPEMTSKAIQISLNHFVFFSKNAPIPTVYAGLSVN